MRRPGWDGTRRNRNQRTASQLSRMRQTAVASVVATIVSLFPRVALAHGPLFPVLLVWFGSVPVLVVQLILGMAMLTERGARTRLALRFVPAVVVVALLLVLSVALEHAVMFFALGGVVAPVVAGVPFTMGLRESGRRKGGFVNLAACAVAPLLLAALGLIAEGM